MGMFSDLLTFGKASCKALGHSAELLAEGAKSLEKSTHVLALKTKIYRLETELELTPATKLDPLQRNRLRQEIFQLCEEVIALEGKHGAADIVKKQQTLEGAMRKQSIEDCIASICRARELGATLQFRLPINEIRHWQDLERNCTELKSWLTTGCDPTWEQRARQYAEEARTRIAELQHLRATQEEFFYPSGARKSVITKYDGRLQGTSMFWYESGAPRLTVEFTGGRVDGAVVFHAMDGSLAGKGHIKSADAADQWQLYLGPERQVAAVNLSQGKGSFKIWLWNGVYAGKTVIRAGKVPWRGLFYMSVLLKPRVWLSIWRARKPGDDQIKFLQMKKNMEQWASVRKEISVM